MDLIKLITEKIKQVESSGELNEIIEEHVIKCINDVVKSCFSFNGEAKKAIEQALSGKLNVIAEEIDIAQYNKIVAGIVNTKIKNTVIHDLQLNIEQTVNNITGILEKKEWKLSEIMAKYIDSLDKSYDGEMDDQTGECAMHVNIDKDFAHIHFDKERKKYFQCENKLFIYKGKLASVTLEDYTFSPFNMKSLDDFESFMFKLYCNNVFIEIDENDCELTYYREDYD